MANQYDFDVMGNYGYGHGYETVDSHSTRGEALESLRNYQANEPGVPFKIKKVASN